MGKVSFYPDTTIGKGHFGSVFSGKLDGAQEVAIKRIEKVLLDFPLIIREAELMMQLKNHSNVLRYICCEVDNDFL